MNRSILHVIVCVIASFLSAVASADLPSYKYVGLSYSTGELDLHVSGIGSANFDEDGFEIEGSYSFLDDHLWVYGSYADLSGDEAGVDLDVETTQFGVGWIFTLGDTTTLDLAATYRQDDLSSGTVGGSGDIDGVGFALGIRSKVTDTVEVYARGGSVEGDYEGGISLDVGAVVDVSDKFSLTASYGLLDFDDLGIDVELTQFQIGGRFNF